VRDAQIKGYQFRPFRASKSANLPAVSLRLPFKLPQIAIPAAEASKLDFWSSKAI
jgi:hypothetical protein